MIRMQNYGNLPLSFEANYGQTNSNVKFWTRSNNYIVFFMPTENIILFGKYDVNDSTLSQLTKNQSQSSMQIKSTVLRTKLIGANPHAQITGLEKLPGKANYFIGSDPTKWHTNVPTYGKIKCQNVYPGIDMIYYGNKQQLEYDFVVAPGTDPETITLDFEGLNQLEIDIHGNLVLHTCAGSIYLHKPFIYQEIHGKKQEISGNYILKNDRQVGIHVGNFDTSKTLIIDPTLIYSTYLGGSSLDESNSIAVDTEGNAYITGFTLSTDFPTTAHSFQSDFSTTFFGADAFITKLNTDGSCRLYSTYLGGNADDIGNGIAVDTNGCAYITGTTTSDNFPTQNALQMSIAGKSNAFISKLNTTGSTLLFSTYLGGKFTDEGNDIGIDPNGNIYVTGSTDSLDFPIKNAFQPIISSGDTDSFICKINPKGSDFIYSTFFGGNGNNIAYSIAIDNSGNAYVTGETTSTNFPIKNALQPNFGGGISDAFVSKLNADGSAFIYSTYLGGNDCDRGFGITADASGNAYVTGETDSSNFPLMNALQSESSTFGDAFITKINTDGSAFIYSTYLGGDSFDHGYAIAIDDAGNAYITGTTMSKDFPIKNALQTDPSRIFTLETFITNITADGSDLIFSTYLGGNKTDEGHGITIDQWGNIYVTGKTSSSNFPIQNAIQPALHGGFDTFVIKISPKDNLLE